MVRLSQNLNDKFQLAHPFKTKISGIMDLVPGPGCNYFKFIGTFSQQHMQIGKKYF